MRDFIAATGVQQCPQRLQRRLVTARVVAVDRFDLPGVVVIDKRLDSLDAIGRVQPHPVASLRSERRQA